MIELDRSEAIRYMGYHGTQPDEAVQASLTRCGEALQQAAEPKSIYRVFPLQHIDAQTLEIADVQIHSKNLARNLQGCSEVCLMAATLGIGPDRLIARASAVRMSDAVIYQAAAAAMVETYCDEVNERIRQDAAQRGMYCRPRFRSRLRRFSDRTPAGFQPSAGYAAQDWLDRDRKLSAGTHQVGNGGDRSV